MLPRGKSSVSRRRVFYIPGYDPHPPRRYRELYRSESAKQADISGFRIEQKSGSSETGWKVRADIEGAQVQSTVDVLVWSDLVQSSMRAGIAGTYLALVKTSWTYISTGTLRRLTWLAKGPVLAALYPILMLLGQLLVAVVAAASLASFAGWLTLTGGAALNRLLGVAPDTGNWVWLLVGGAVFWVIFLPICLLILRWFKSKDDKTYAYYLMHDYAYTAKKRGAYPDEIEARLHEFRHRIEAALREEIEGFDRRSLFGRATGGLTCGRYVAR